MKKYLLLFIVSGFYSITNTGTFYKSSSYKPVKVKPRSYYKHQYASEGPSLITKESYDYTDPVGHVDKTYDEAPLTDIYTRYNQLDFE